MSDEQTALVGVPKKRGRKPGLAAAKKKLRLGRFDLDAIRIIMAGKSLYDLCLELGVDEKEAETRLTELVEANYLVKGEKGFRLGLAGYNKIGFKLVRKKFVESTGRNAVPLQDSRREEKMDLGEMLRLGAPKNEKKMEAPPYVSHEQASYSKKEKPAEKTVEKPAEPAMQKSVASDKDCCELCKAAFKVGGKDNAPKFAHCVCGVAYHKDCYESLVEEGGKCISCGKKLSTVLDKSGEDAVKGIKTMY